MFVNDLARPIRNLGSVAGTLALDSSIGQHVRAFLTGDTLIAAPTNAIDGAYLEMWLSAGSADRVLTIDSSIQGGVNGLADLFPWTCSAGTTVFFVLRFDASRKVWFVADCAGAY